MSDNSSNILFFILSNICFSVTPLILLFTAGGIPTGYIIVWIIFNIILIASINSEHKNKIRNEEECRRKNELYQKVKISQLDYLQPKAFEEWAGKLFEELGYDVQVLKRNQHFGIDIILKTSNKTIGVQAVRNSDTVGIQPVRDAIKGINYHKCDQAWVITNAKYYSKNAISFANQNNVILIACNDIVSLLEKLDMDTNFKSLNPQNNTLVPQKYITAKMPFIKKIGE